MYGRIHGQSVYERSTNFSAKTLLRLRFVIDVEVVIETYNRLVYNMSIGVAAEPRLHFDGRNRVSGPI